MSRGLGDVYKRQAVDTGEVVIGIAVAYIRIDVMMEHVIPTEIVSLLHKELHAGVL